jgi:hypothetical protein
VSLCDQGEKSTARGCAAGEKQGISTLVKIRKQSRKGHRETIMSVGMVTITA